MSQAEVSTVDERQATESFLHGRLDSDETRNWVRRLLSRTDAGALPAPGPALFSRLPTAEDDPPPTLRFRWPVTYELLSDKDLRQTLEPPSLR